MSFKINKKLIKQEYITRAEVRKVLETPFEVV